MHADDDGGFVTEEVERRAEPRGVIHGLAISAPGDRHLEVLEVSRKGFFVAIDNPEVFLLGDTFDVAVTYHEVRFTCRVEVVRKEIRPRRGVALRTVHLAPAAEESLARILDDM
jgi:hypothetical protein